jgi:hypothetical protein
MVDFIIKLQNLGCEVSVITLDINSKLLDPFSMVGAFGVIDKNIQPFKLSKYK